MEMKMKTEMEKAMAMIAAPPHPRPAHVYPGTTMASNGVSVVRSKRRGRQILHERIKAPSETFQHSSSKSLPLRVAYHLQSNI